MGDGDPALSAARRARSERERSLAALTGVLAGLLLLVGLQVLLLMIGVESWMAGRGGILGAVAVASGLCCAAAWWLLRSPGGRGPG